MNAATVSVAVIRFGTPGCMTMKSPLTILACACVLILLAVPAGAQNLTGCSASWSENRSRIGEGHWRFVGGVEFDCGDTKLYADEAEIFINEDRAVATGNVVMAQAQSRIAADRADFNTRTRLGTFYNATGFSTLQPQKQRPTSGQAAAPRLVGEENTVYFFGQTVEKIGTKKYRITNGGFSTCVQPTPRWELSSNAVVLNVDHYTTLRNAILSVKGVPMLYIPYLYYPTKKEDRATGFLIPTYGSSTLRGQSLHNAFFWAVDRSQDATFVYDWFSKTGQGTGSEYRYNFGGGSDGNIHAYMLDNHESSYSNSDGSTSTLPASRSFEVRGSANQVLPGRLRARGNVSYFSSLQTMQTFNTNIYDASRTTRSFGGNVVGAWNYYTMNATLDHSEYFFGDGTSNVSGSWPRVSFNRNERPLFGSNLYFSVGSEYARLLRDGKSPGAADVDSGLTRLDFTPQVRFPFKKWQWFTVNTSLGWRDTFYSRSCAPSSDPEAVCDPNQITDNSVNRRYFIGSAQMVGPVFTRVWDTPGNGYAEKFKHTIEPTLSITRTSSIDNYSQIVQLEGTDAVVGGSTQYAYGLTNRFFAKRKLVPGQPGQARDILDVDITQTYYTDQNASRVDRQYATSFTGAPPSHFSPIALNIRAVPADEINTTVRAEFDSQYHSLRTISANASYAWSGRVQSSLGWSKKGYIPELTGFNDKAYLDQYLNGSANVHTKDNRVGGLYSFNYDLLRSSMLQQRFSIFYNAQCCGAAFEFQSYNLSGTSSPVPADHRFFFSFTLAGLGNFSPFNGALGGVPR